MRSKKKKITLFVCREGGITNPLKTPAHQVQDYFGSFRWVSLDSVKIVNSLNCINRCIKFRKRNRLLVTFVVFFYRFVDFLTLNTLTQLYLKNLYTFRTNIVSRSYRIIKDLAPTVIRIWLCFGQRSRFFACF